MSTSAVPSLIDYLVTAARAADTLGARTPNPVTVNDGPPVSNDWPQYVLWVGLDEGFLMPDSGIVALAAEGTQEWVGPGNRQRNEHGVIHCVADSWTGASGPDMKPARDQAYGIVAAVEDMTRSDANAGGTVLFTEPGVTNQKLYYAKTQAGTRVLVAFDFAYFARIGS